MTELVQFIAVLLAAFGLVCLGWLALGLLLLPGECAVRMVIDARGGADGLEQTVKGALWLRHTGLWRGEIVIRDRGLDEDGGLLVRTLARESGVLFTGDVPDRV